MLADLTKGKHIHNNIYCIIRNFQKIFVRHPAFLSAKSCSVMCVYVCMCICVCVFTSFQSVLLSKYAHNSFCEYVYGISCHVIYIMYVFRDMISIKHNKNVTVLFILLNKWIWNKSATSILSKYLNIIFLF